MLPNHSKCYIIPPNPKYTETLRLVVLSIGFRCILGYAKSAYKNLHTISSKYTHGFICPHKASDCIDDLGS